jgi:sporulation protein YlmC with PRC-barrel domain
MKKMIIGLTLAAALTTGAYAATMTMAAAPAECWTVTNYYKQAVYDPQESKIGTVEDVLIDKSGKVTGLILGVGGFLGAGQKDVIVAFTAVETAKKNDSWWLTKPRMTLRTRRALPTIRRAPPGCLKRSKQYRLEL